MKITAVTTAATAGHCMQMWVRIDTDAGITGLGECVHGGHAAIALIQLDEEVARAHQYPGTTWFE